MLSRLVALGFSLVLSVLRLGAQSPFVNVTLNPESPTPSLGVGYNYTAQIATSANQSVWLVFFTFAPWPAAPYSCKVGVSLLNHGGVSPGFFIHDDQGVPLPSIFQGTQANSQCVINASLSSFSGQPGSVYTVAVNVAFNSPYDGSRLVWLDAFDPNLPANSNNTSWLPFSPLSVAGGQPSKPQIVSISPNVGVSREGEIESFSVRIRDTVGGLYIWHVEFMFGQGTNWNQGSVFFDNPNRCKVVGETTANLWWLEEPGPQNNNLDNLPQSGIEQGPGPVISNQLCTFYTQFVQSEQLDEDTVEVTFPVAFSSQFDGFLQSHSFAANKSGSPGVWHSNWDAQYSTCPADHPVCPFPRWYVWPSSTNTSPPGQTFSDGGSSQQSPAFPALIKPPAAPSPAFDTFAACLQGQSAPPCILPAYTDASGNVVPYLVSQTIPITASGISITGSGGVLIQRDADYNAYRGSLIFQMGSGVNHVTISGITVLGNRNGIGDPLIASVFQNPAQQLGPRLNDRCGGFLDLQGYGECVDVQISGSSITLSNNYLYDAPAHALLISSNNVSGDATNISISGGEIDNSHLTGLLVRGSYEGSDRANCPSSASFATGVPSNLDFSGITFRNNLTGAISVGNAFNASIGLNGANSFYDNQANPDADEPVGGIIVEAACVAGLTIANNLIDNTNIGNPGALGLELYGLNGRVLNNVIQNVAAAGMDLDGTCGTFVSGGTVRRADFAQSGGTSGVGTAFTGGIDIQNQTTSPAAQDILVSNTTSTSNYSGVAVQSFFSLTGRAPQFSNVVVQNSNLCGNVVGPTYFFGYPQPPGVNIISNPNGCSVSPGGPSAPVCSIFH